MKNNNIDIPFKSFAGFSCETSIDEKNFKVIKPGAVRAPMIELVHSQLQGLILNKSFPCYGAKSAFNTKSYQFALYQTMADPEATMGLCYDLYNFVKELSKSNNSLSTFICSFLEPRTINEEQFEKLLWKQLQVLNKWDSKYFPWCSHVSPDPKESDFAFSFAECPFFVVGLHSASSRYSRRFSYPTLIFNPHYQFEELKRIGKYEPMKKRIREKDSKLQGDINPMLSDFGNASQAIQYSGRKVDPSSWKCPFSAKKIV